MVSRSAPDEANEFSLVFICELNRCRSPMAELLARQAIEAAGIDGWRVSSAGVKAQDGLEMHHLAKAALALDYRVPEQSWKSRRMTESILADADLVLTMSSNQRRAVVMAKPSHIGRTFTLLHFVGLVSVADRIDIAAPVTGTELLKAAVRARPRFAPRESGWDTVADPVGADLAAFRDCAALLAQSLSVLIAALSGHADLHT